MSNTRPVTRSYLKTQRLAMTSQDPSSMNNDSPIIVTHNNPCVKDTPVDCQNEVLPSKPSNKNACKNKSKSPTIQLPDKFLSNQEVSKKRTICTSSIENQNPSKKSKSDNCLATASRTIQTRSMSKKMAVSNSESPLKKQRTSDNVVTPSPDLLKSTSQRCTNKMPIAYVNLKESQWMDDQSCCTTISSLSFHDERHEEFVALRKEAATWRKEAAILRKEVEILTFLLETRHTCCDNFTDSDTDDDNDNDHWV